MKVSTVALGKTDKKISDELKGAAWLQSPGFERSG